MRKKQFYGIGLLILFSFVFAIVQTTRWYNPISYLILLILIDVSIIVINEGILVSANTLFIFFCTYSVALGPIILMARGIEYRYSYYSVILGGLLAFGWGNAVAVLGKKQNIRNRSEKGGLTFKLSRKTILRLLLAFSILASLYYLISNKAYLLGRNIQSGRVDAMSGNGIVLHILQLPVLVIPTMYDLYKQGRDSDRCFVSKIEIIAMIIVSSGTLIVCGFRGPLLAMYICLAILYIRKNYLQYGRIIGLGILFVFIAGTLGMIRSVISGQGLLGGTIAQAFSASLFVNCINLNYVCNAFPSRISFQYGHTYLINFIMLLPGPDPDFTTWLKESLNMTFSGGGITPTIMGEFYINFGFVGIYIGMFLLGILGVHVWRYFKKHSESFLGAYFVWQFAHCASGGIANVIIQAMFYGIVYQFILMFPPYLSREGSVWSIEKN